MTGPSNNIIPVIDLFAGPGGLGEGFSAYQDKHGDSRFKVRLSIEKEAIRLAGRPMGSFSRLPMPPVSDEWREKLRSAMLKCGYIS